MARLNVTQKRCYAVNTRGLFASTDVRKLTTKAALDKHYINLHPKPENSFITTPLRMAYREMQGSLD